MTTQCYIYQVIFIDLSCYFVDCILEIGESCFVIKQFCYVILLPTFFFDKEITHFIYLKWQSPIAGIK